MTNTNGLAPLGRPDTLGVPGEECRVGSGKGENQGNIQDITHKRTNPSSSSSVFPALSFPPAPRSPLLQALLLRRQLRKGLRQGRAGMRTVNSIICTISLSEKPVPKLLFTVSLILVTSFRQHKWKGVSCFWKSSPSSVGMRRLQWIATRQDKTWTILAPTSLTRKCQRVLA